MKKTTIAAALLLSVSAAFLAVGLAAWAYVSGAAGSARLLTYALTRSLPVKAIGYERAAGSLTSGLAIRGLSIRLRGGEYLSVEEVELEPIRSWPFEPFFRAKGIRLESRWVAGCQIASAEGSPRRILTGPVKAASIRLGNGPRSVKLKGGTLAARAAEWAPKDSLTLEDLEIAGGPAFAGARVDAQKAVIDLRSGHAGIREIVNGRLRLGSSEPVLFYGAAAPERMDLHLFAKELELRDLLELLPDQTYARFASGTLEKVELRVAGAAAEPAVSGRMSVRNFSYRQFHLRDSPWKTEGLRLRREEDRLSVNGRLSVEGGRLTRGATTMSVEPGTLDFDGDAAAPRMDLGAATTIDRSRIRLVLRGTPDKPDFRLTSDPLHPEEKLIVMLATGRGWTGSEKAIQEGRLSLDATREFLDYFLLGGSGGRLAERMGIKEVSLGVTEESESLRVKKAVAKKIDLGYGVEKKGGGQKDPAVIEQSVAVDYNVSRNTTISVEGKVAGKPDAAERAPDDSDSSATDKSVLMKVNRRF